MSREEEIYQQCVLDRLFNGQILGQYNREVEDE